jgi:competence protein ComEC
VTLIYLSIAWVAGIYIGSKLGLPVWSIATAILPLLLIPFLSRYKITLLITGLCLFAFLSGNLHFQSSLPSIDEQHLQFYNDQGKAEIEGMITTEPEARDKALFFQLSTSKITIDGKAKEISGKAIIRAPRYSEYHYGDILKVNGKMETPPQFDDFDYRAYLAHQGIYSMMYYPKIEILKRDAGSKALSFIYSARNSLNQSLSRTLSEPQCSLAQGILLGLRGNIPDSLTQAFSRTGTTHILAISGLNLSIVIGMILSIGVWLFGRRYSVSIWIALGAIWLYAIFTGMHPPIVRGAIMGSMFLFAEFLGRQRSASTALSFAAAVMVGIEPQILWDVSFQLSFLSMAGLIFIFPHLQSWNKKRMIASPDTGGTTTSIYTITIDSLSITLAAIIATLPAVAYYFGTVSLSALPANFFAIPALPPIIISTALVSVIGLLLPLVAQVIGWLAWFFLSYFILIVQIFDALPFSSIRLENISAWQILIYYVLLIVAIAILTHRNQFSSFFSHTASTIGQRARNISETVSTRMKKWSIISLAISVILTWIVIINIPDDKLHVHILNVGQGDAILIQTPNRQNILIDGGPSPQAINLELGKKLPFWDKTIDLMLLTQPQADHITGLIEVLQYYNVKQVIESALTANSLIHAQWLKIVEDKKINHSTGCAGQEINMGDDINIEILHPPKSLLKSNYDNINDNGLVLRVSYKAVSFLLTADIGEEAEWHLISQRANLQSTVLKVAHHGSQSSTSPELLAVANPKAAVVSVGSNNNFGHPHHDVIARLIQKVGEDKILLTSRNGTVEFITDGNRLWAKTER